MFTQEAQLEGIIKNYFLLFLKFILSKGGKTKLILNTSQFVLKTTLNLYWFRNYDQGNNYFQISLRRKNVRRKEI
jgi:hypothetical protein